MPEPIAVVMRGCGAFHRALCPMAFAALAPGKVSASSRANIATELRLRSDRRGWRKRLPSGTRTARATSPRRMEIWYQRPV